MHGDESESAAWRRAFVAGVVLAVLVAPVASTGVGASPVGIEGSAESLRTAALGGPTAHQLQGLPSAPWVNKSDSSHDPTTTTLLSVAYNATGEVGSASDVTVEVVNDSSGSVVAANSSVPGTEGSANLTVSAGTFSGDQSVTYRLKNGSGTVIATDTSMLASSVGGGDSGLSPAPWVNKSDSSHDPTTTTLLSVAYNATGEVGSASDVTVEVVNDSSGSVVATNSSLTATEGFAMLTVSAGTFSGDQSVTYRLKNGSGSVVATDTSTLAASGGGGDGGTAQITIDSASLSSQSVAPESNFDIDVVLNNTGSASGSTTLIVFDVGTTDSISELANRSVSVGASTTTTETVTVSLADAGLSDLYVTAGTSFERKQVLVQPSSSLSVTGYSVSKTTVEQNEDTTVTATVSNPGASEDWMLVPLYQDGSVTQVENVTVPAGGQKQVDITTTFASAGSHTVTVGGQSATSVTVQTRGSPSVVDSSVTVVGGTQPTGTVVASTSVSNGKLDVRLKAQGVQNGEADLSTVGADSTTRFEVEIELENFTPRMMMGTGGNVSWSVGPGSSADTSNLTLTLEPREAQRLYFDDGTEPTYQSWPNTDDQATTSRQAQAQFSFYNMANAPVRFRTTLTGGTIVTDAQSFSPPMYKQGSNTQKPRLTVQVAGPHLTVDGSQNQGYYEALIPNGMLDQWGITSAGQLRAAYAGSQTQATFTRTSKGIQMKLDVHYSSGTVEIQPGETDTTAPTADAGADATVTAGDSVDFDASSTSDDVGIKSYEWDFDGDGTYDTSTTSPTVSHVYSSAGTKTATLRVTDGADNTDTDTVTVTVESGATGGGGSGSAAVGPSVDVSTTGGSASVDVTGATAESPVDVDFGVAPPVAENLRLNSMSVAAAEDFDLSVSLADDRSSLPAGTDSVPALPGDGDGQSRALGYLSVEHPSLSNDEIEGATVTLTVDAATLDERDVEPHDVVIYRYHEGAWSALDTRVVSATADGYRIEGEAPGLSVFAIAAGAPSFRVDGARLSTTTLSVTESATVEATVENVGTAAGTHTVDLRIDGETAATRTVRLNAGESATVSFGVAPETPGTYAVRVDDAAAGDLVVDRAADATATATARPTATATPDKDAPTATATRTATPDGGASAPGFGFVVALLALLGAGLLAGRR